MIKASVNPELLFLNTRRLSPVLLMEIDKPTVFQKWAGIFGFLGLTAAPCRSSPVEQCC